MYAREVIPEYALSMTCEAHYPSVREDDLTDEQGYGRLTEEYDLKYQEDLEGSLLEEVQKAVKMIRTGNASMRA